MQNTWDEICVQVQGGKSFFWDAYDETVRALIEGYVDELPPHEREAIWLQSPEGREWSGDEEDENREPYPVFQDDIVNYIVQKYVYAEADTWTNSRIRAFVERYDCLD